MTNRLRERLIETTLALVKIPSVTGEEREIAHHIERWALSLPNIPRDDVVRHGNNIVIGQPDGNRPCLALVGHLDTVPPHPSGPTRVEGNRIYGRGGSDMKAGIAVMQVLMEDLVPAQLPFTLMLIFYDREEGNYAESGLGVLLEKLDILSGIDLAIILEPTNNDLHLGCLGAAHARVVFHGRPAHSARPWEGENAIHKAGALLSRLHALAPREVLAGGLTFWESMSATLAKGGATRNVIPDRFELNLNYRFAPTGNPQDDMARAADLLRQMAPDAEVDVYDNSPPAPVPSENPIINHLLALNRLAVAPKLAWTDVGRLALVNIDAINFGPGLTSQAHQPNEWVECDALVRSYEVLHRTLTNPLAEGALSA